MKLTCQSVSALAIVLILIAATAVDVSAQVPDAAASDPAKLGWMGGSPPPADRALHFEDGSCFRFSALRWSVSNLRQLMPTVNVSRGLQAPAPLKRTLGDDIDEVRFTPPGAAKPTTRAESLTVNYTDGILVLHSWLRFPNHSCNNPDKFLNAEQLAGKQKLLLPLSPPGVFV
jgi:hypothetical protein